MLNAKRFLIDYNYSQIFSKYVRPTHHFSSDLLIVLEMYGGKNN